MVFGRLIARRPKSRGMRSQGSAMISDPGGSAFGSVASEPISPIKLCIEDLNNAIFPQEERFIALANAQKVLHHTQPDKHDEEVTKYGAANTLFVKLSFAVACHHSDEEIRRACDLLSYVHMCNPPAIERIYGEIGYESLPLIVRVLRLPFATVLEKPENQGIFASLDDDTRLEQQKALVKAGINASQDLKLAVQRMCKILARYSSIMVEARPIIAAEPNLLKSLMLVMEYAYDMPLEARCSALATLCNLAQNEKNHIVMASEPFLLESVCKMALQTVKTGPFLPNVPYQQLPSHHPAKPILQQQQQPPPGMTYEQHQRKMKAEHEALGEGTILGVRQVAAMTLMHLSYGDKDHIPLVDEKSLVILDTYQTLLQMDIRQASTPQLAQQIHEARRFASIGLYNFACGDENTLRVTHHRKGSMLEVLLAIVTQPREDFELRVIAMETLYNLSCCSDGTSESLEVAKQMGLHPGMLMALGSIVRFRDAPERVQEVAAMTLHRLAQLIHCDMPSGCHALLLGALVQGASWTKTAHMAQAFEVQAKLTEEHLNLMTHHLGLLNGISAQALLVSEEEVIRAIRQSALTTILLLHTLESNRIHLANNEGVMLALTRASFDKYYIKHPRNKEEEEFGARIQTVHEALKQLVNEL